MKINTLQIAEKPKMIQTLSYSEIVSADFVSTSKNSWKINTALIIPILINAHITCVCISAHNDNILSILESWQ